MGRMLELIREGKAPAAIVRRAVRGELALPAAEAVEILALLAADRELGSEAEQTLRGWEEASLKEVAANPETAPEVLRCLLHTQAERPAVIAVLCGNPALALEELETAAGWGGTAMLDAMMGSARVRSSPQLLKAIGRNTASGPLPSQPEPQPVAVAEGAEADRAGESVHLHQSGHLHHAGEPKDEEDRPFELVTDAESEADPLAELLKRAKHGETAASPMAAKPEEKEHLSLLQRIVHMRVGDRIKLAMRGGREERMVLIRDRSKLVSLAVLASPKVDSSEMECFAAMKNVQEAVLRAIAGNRKNMKNYGVVRALVSNPKSPLDVSLPLLPHLLIKDLRGLAINKNVNETIRKRAARMVREKSEQKID